MARRITTGEVGGAGSSGLNITNTVLSAAEDLDIVVEPKGTGIFIVAGDTTLEAQGDLRFSDADNSNWVAFQAPATINSNVLWTLPAADGSNNQVLTTNSSGTLSWTSKDIALTDQTVTSSTHYVTLTTSSSGVVTSLNTSTTRLSFVPSTSTLSAAIFTGSAATTATALTAANTTFYPTFVSSNASTTAQTHSVASAFTFNASNGTLTATIVTASSDARLKENVRPIEGALDKVLSLCGVEFNRIGHTTTEIGVIAQKVEEVVPSLVVTGADGFKSVAYGNAIALLIEAIKEQQVQIKELQIRRV